MKFRPYPKTFDIPRITREWTDLTPHGGARVILADPPWRFDNFSTAGEKKNPSVHYACHTIEDLMSLPIDLLAGPDCALFLWCTWPLMPAWTELLSAWRFDYSGLAWEWIKFNPETGKYAFGPGYGTRKNVEPCILSTRGDPMLAHELEFFGVTDAGFRRSRNVRDFILCNSLDAIRAARREHSRKPDEAYNRIEALFEGPRVEIFARSERPGWRSWGDEIQKFGGSVPSEGDGDDVMEPD